MAKYSTHKNSNEYKNAITLERKRIRAAKYAVQNEKESDKELRALARDIHALVAPFVYVPQSPARIHTNAGKKVN